MRQSTYRFEFPTRHRSIIKVMGIGGGGSNAVNTMYHHGIQDVSFVVCNTDAQALESSPVPNKLQLGINLTSGLGAGANPEVGKNAAIESKEDIRKLISDGTRMVFITAGMGGGTGTGAAPIIASVAKQLDILTVGIVTMPFSFEGKKKMERAQEGLDQLRQQCDTVLVILNDRLKEMLGNLSISEAFSQADNVLTTAAKSIAEVITVPGYVNVDFEDVKTVMKDAGAAVMGSGTAEGENRALRAAEQALASPLLDNKNIHGAKKILLSIVSGKTPELQMEELAIITDFIQEEVGSDAEVIFGHGTDGLLGNKLRVTVIATGFESESEQQRQRQQQISFTSNKNTSITQTALFDLPESATEAGKGKSRLKRNRAIKQPAELVASATPLLTDTSLSPLSYQNALQSEEARQRLLLPAYLRKNITLHTLQTSENTVKLHLQIERSRKEKK